MSELFIFLSLSNNRRSLIIYRKKCKKNFIKMQNSEICEGTWKGYLFRLQGEAPQPIPVINEDLQVMKRCPQHYGSEWHGKIDRITAENRCSVDGNFLIRQSQTEHNRHVFVLRILGVVKNFKLFYEEGKHFVGEKKFESIFDLAKDGLITMYVEEKARDYINRMTNEPVYKSLNRYSSLDCSKSPTNETPTTVTSSSISDEYYLDDDDVSSNDSCAVVQNRGSFHQNEQNFQVKKYLKDERKKRSSRKHSPLGGGEERNSSMLRRHNSSYYKKTPSPRHQHQQQHHQYDEVTSCNEEHGNFIHKISTAKISKIHTRQTSDPTTPHHRNGMFRHSTTSSTSPDDCNQTPPPPMTSSSRHHHRSTSYQKSKKKILQQRDDVAAGDDVIITVKNPTTGVGESHHQGSGARHRRNSFDTSSLYYYKDVGPLEATPERQLPNLNENFVQDYFPTSKHQQQQQQQQQQPRHHHHHQKENEEEEIKKESKKFQQNYHDYEKQHNFKIHTYRMQWCEYCGNFMWGFIQQGMQCTDCELNVHKQCSKLIPCDCQPSSKFFKHIFGVDLTTVVKIRSTLRPIVVDMCIDEIESRGIHAEGIYRIPGCHDDIMKLKATFDRDINEVDMKEIGDVNTIAGVLKMYLRELPQPLLPFELYSRFINAAKLTPEDGKIKAIKDGITLLPRAHYETLKFLVSHLGRVADQCSYNQMNSDNLGIVFGPTLLRAPERSSNGTSSSHQINYDLNDNLFQQNLVSTIISYRYSFFHIQQ